MIVLVLFGISLVLGTIGGVSWRLFEDWQDKNEARRVEEARTKVA